MAIDSNNPPGKQYLTGHSDTEITYSDAVALSSFAGTLAGSGAANLAALSGANVMTTSDFNNLLTNKDFIGGNSLPVSVTGTGGSCTFSKAGSMGLFKVVLTAAAAGDFTFVAPVAGRIYKMHMFTTTHGNADSTIKVVNGTDDVCAVTAADTGEYIDMAISDPTDTEFAASDVLKLTLAQSGGSHTGEVAIHVIL